MEQPETAPAGRSLTLRVGQDARYIRVQLIGSDRPLSLAEVEVFSNMAVDAPASQSSTLNSSMGAAGRAVDGNTNGDFFAGSVTHTGENPYDTNPWWQVDLGSSQQVGTVELWNRTDCCPDRLRQFYVFASATPFTSNDPQATAAQSGVWSSLQTAPAGRSLTLRVGQDARYIRVQLIGSDRPLSLAEVEVFS